LQRGGRRFKSVWLHFVSIILSSVCSTFEIQLHGLLKLLRHRNYDVWKGNVTYAKTEESCTKNCRDRNQAFSWYKGRRYYHGVWGSPEAVKNYKLFLNRLTENPDLLMQVDGTGDVFVSELAAEFLRYAESLNMDKVGVGHFKRVIGFLVETYGELVANEFSPKKLKVVRNKIAKAGTLCRIMINDYTRRIVHIFKWGVGEEFVVPNIVVALREVKALRKGEQGVRDNPPRREVADDVVKRTLPFMPPTIAAMVRVQRQTGMRPSEICRMMVGDINRLKEQDGLWHYVLKTHKTERHVGIGKIVPLGPKEQRLIAPYLAGKSADESVFSPHQAVRERREHLRAERKSKLTPSQRERDRFRAKHPAEKVGDFYDKHSYRKAIEHAIKKANKILPDAEKIPNWTPYQLRHAAATATEEAEGLDIAQAQLGHTSVNTTKRYAHAQLKIAEELALNRQDPFDEPTELKKT